MTAEEMAVDGYNVEAGIARHDYKQGWEFVTLWGCYGGSEATWEPMSASSNLTGPSTPCFVSTSLRTMGLNSHVLCPMSQQKRSN